MTKLSVGGYLLPAAANNFELWRQRAEKDGYNLTITSAADAFREYEIQERIFRERYTTTRLPGRPTKRWNNTVWYLKPGQSTAAVPGTSNHGKGLALDIKNAGGFGGSFYKWMARTGPEYGWSNTEGRSINEPWHWVNDNQPRGAASTVADALSKIKPELPTAEDEEMFRIRVDAKTNGVPNAEGHTIFLCQFGSSATAVFRSLTPDENAALDRAGIPLRKVKDGKTERDFSQFEKDKMRESIINIALKWGIN